ncbi:MAG: hypothetical protein JSU77_13220 [Fidelibacterota bacterium]|nr:MAG: hypothetical protein JSU77_13220 [Candidatus Neomarinimicrobiota bacterium]
MNLPEQCIDGSIEGSGVGTGMKMNLLGGRSLATNYSFKDFGLFGISRPLPGMGAFIVCTARAGRVGHRYLAGLLSGVFFLIGYERAAEFQPNIWSAIFVEGEEEKIDAIVSKISLFISPKWYANISNATTEYVISHGKVLKHRKGDKTGAAEAIKYGRSIGIPEYQLDWMWIFSIGK